MSDRILTWSFSTSVTTEGATLPADHEVVENLPGFSLYGEGARGFFVLTDALACGIGTTLCRIEFTGNIARNAHRASGARYRILWRIEAAPVLRRFARELARDALPFWDAPPIVRQFLETGDESLRAEAFELARQLPWSEDSRAPRASWIAACAATADLRQGVRSAIQETETLHRATGAEDRLLPLNIRLLKMVEDARIIQERAA